MSAETEITNQPIFYLFIAFTIFLVLGYSWGRRKNSRIYKKAFEELIHVLKPKEQNFTNIGGLTGYHANFLPQSTKGIVRVDATITLLPRQALLYFPFSRLVRGFDRLFLTLYLEKSPKKEIEEAHLIEKRYSKFKAPKITNQDRLHLEEVSWEKKQFYLHSGSQKSNQAMHGLKSKKGLPGEIRHIAFMPEQKKAFVFLVPKPGSVSQTLPKVISWIEQQLKP